MSRRTAESNKAIAEAWKSEQELVRNGKGTRDWTPEQQQDIITRGKAYDINGKAFEGQHMRSVENFPTHQGDPKNIQFLSREEHLEAHNGDWQNPTNWYYDPVSKAKMDFGNGPIIPCKTIHLSNPIYSSTNNQNESISFDYAFKESNPSNKSTQATSSNPYVFSESKQLLADNKSNKEPQKSFIKKIVHYAQKIWKGAKIVATEIKDLAKENPELFISTTFTITVNVVKVVANIASLSSSKPTIPTSIVNNSQSLNVVAKTHDSPIAHIVSGHVQRYHTKNGIVVIHKASYYRGK